MMGWSFFLRALAAAVALSCSSASTLKRILFSQPDVVCTDGSPAGYYWAPATSASLNSTWVLYLEGGGWCYDEASCTSRCGPASSPNTADPLCSSKQWPAELDELGLYEPAQPSLAGANRLFVHYCTSDGHMGDTATMGRHFRGARVVQAVLDDAVAKGLGDGSRPGRDLLVFGGGSAGARGAMVHLDYVPSMLGAAAAGVRVVGFLDSPLWLDISPFLPGRTSLAQTTRDVHAYANVSHLGAECASAYPGEEGWRCLFGQYRVPTLQTPYLLVASQYDAFQLGWNVGHRPATQPEQSYAEAFASKTAALVTAVRARWGNRTGSNAVFSWACYNHDTSLSDAGFNEDYCGPQKATMGGALAQTMGTLSPDGSGFEWLDNCSGFACSKGCAAGP